MKWCLVAAGLKDLNRPADKLSVSQNVGEYRLMLSDILNAFISRIYSPGVHRIHLGSLLLRHYTHQPQSCCRKLVLGFSLTISCTDVS